MNSDRTLLLHYCGRCSIHGANNLKWRGKNVPCVLTADCQYLSDSHIRRKKARAMRRAEKRKAIKEGLEEYGT